MTMTGTIRNATFVMNKILRDNVPSVNKRVFPPGVTTTADVPRIQLHLLSPADRPAALGAGLPAFKFCAFRIAIFARKPQDCDTVAAEVEDAIANNRYYSVSTIPLTDNLGVTTTVNTNGYFLLGRLAGGTETRTSQAMGLFERVVLASVEWLQSS